MNNFLFEERITEEYRRVKMAAAEEHNRSAHLVESKVAILTYQGLAKLGKALESSGQKMRARYEALALQEKDNPLPAPAK
ncbi:MAG: hypothetical protein HN390_03000 [Anaerolineae bacterium]|jgi:hypothetical protein|nr:hypothetical protein [Anaerolineae bacterium]MBT7190283.1 hypothetical protein [Anaerolineae bacterium]MBT7990223.1 hypothetical protein [Anaerolineae bacterium]